MVDKIYVLKRKKIDMFGEDPELWEIIGFTEQHDVAVKLFHSSHMYVRYEFEVVKRYKGDE